VSVTTATGLSILFKLEKNICEFAPYCWYVKKNTPDRDEN